MRIFYEKKSFLSKRILSIFLLFVFALNTMYIGKVFAFDNPPNVAADSAVLIDATTGEILFQKNMNDAYPPASTTKVMTAILTLENCDLDDIVTVGPNAVGIEGNKLWLVEGEQFTVKTFLKGLMLDSDNDVAIALAEHIAGSVDNFAKMMTDRAKELGCKNTNFLNPNGLDQDGHMTSAYDLTLMMQELIKYPEYREIAKLTGFEINGTNKRPNEKIERGNYNRAVKEWEEVYYEYAEAGKTGFTDEAQHSYVTSAKKGNQRLIAAFIHDEQKRYFFDSADLFDYGFENFELVKLYSKGDSVLDYKDAEGKEITLLAEEDFYFVKKKDSTSTPVPKIDNIELANKKYYRGDYIGTASISSDTSTRTLKLVAGTEYEPGSKNTFVTLDSDKEKSKDTGTVDNKNAEESIEKGKEIPAKVDNKDNPSDKQVNDSANNSDNNHKPSKLPFVIIIVVIIIAIIIVRMLQIRVAKKRNKKKFNPYIK